MITVSITILSIETHSVATYNIKTISIIANLRHTDQLNVVAK
jgi:hypothetical protein